MAYLEFLFGGYAPVLERLLKTPDRVLSAPHSRHFFTRAVRLSRVRHAVWERCRQYLRRERGRGEGTTYEWPP